MKQQSIGRRHGRTVTLRSSRTPYATLETRKLGGEKKCDHRNADYPGNACEHEAKHTVGKRQRHAKDMQVFSARGQCNTQQTAFDILMLGAW